MIQEYWASKVIFIGIFSQSTMAILKNTNRLQLFILLNLIYLSHCILEKFSLTLLSSMQISVAIVNDQEIIAILS